MAKGKGQKAEGRRHRAEAKSILIVKFVKP
jgi:hypothetical protein